MTNRRKFIRRSVAAGAGFLAGIKSHAVTHLEGLLPQIADQPESAVAENEGFWLGVRDAFDLEPGYTNLNHGLSPAPLQLHDAFTHEMARVNRSPLLYMSDWPAEGRREEARRAAAAALGCDAEELAITRGATESLQIAQLGIDLRPGDEVLSTREDYWAMWNTWQQRVERDGIVYRDVDLGGPYPQDSEIVERFAEAITPRTRVIHFSHVTWVTGHVMPVREICELASRRGIQTIVDGAQAFAHIPFEVNRLGCDYYGTSGHKWLHAPLGTGMLYVRREHIPALWPLTPGYEEKWGSDIRKFEFVGSRSPAHHNSIEGAVLFLRRLGVERKAARLAYLTRRWAEPLSRHARLRLITDLAEGRSFGVGGFYVDGIDSEDLVAELRTRHRILVGAPGPDAYGGPRSVRVVPNVFTSVHEVDAFVRSVQGLISA